MCWAPRNLLWPYITYSRSTFGNYWLGTAACLLNLNWLLFCWWLIWWLLYNFTSWHWRYFLARRLQTIYGLLRNNNISESKTIQYIFMKSFVEQFYKLWIVFQFFDSGCFFQAAAISNIFHELVFNQLA